MKRSGFTMIELIFVIVILGILAAVAIPKLAATRDDAKVARLSSDAATIVSDVGAYYTANGAVGPWATMTNVKVYSDTALTLDANESNTSLPVYIGDTEGCFSFLRTSDGNLTITGVGTSSACAGAKIAAKKLITTHSFGGSKVKY